MDTLAETERCRFPAERDRRHLDNYTYNPKISLEGHKYDFSVSFSASRSRIRIIVPKALAVRNGGFPLVPFATLSIPPF